MIFDDITQWLSKISSVTVSSYRPFKVAHEGVVQQVREDLDAWVFIKNALTTIIMSLSHGIHTWYWNFIFQFSHERRIDPDTFLNIKYLRLKIIQDLFTHFVTRLWVKLFAIIHDFLQAPSLYAYLQIIETSSTSVIRCNTVLGSGQLGLCHWLNLLIGLNNRTINMNNH